MWRTVLFIVAGLAVGFAAAHWLASSPPESGAVPTFGESAPAASELPARFAELEHALHSEIERRAALEQRVAELGAELADLRAAAGASSSVRAADAGATSESATSAAAEGAVVPPGFGRRFRGAETSDQRIAQLVAAGFSPDRAAWIEKRNSELVMQTIQAQYAQRRGENVDPAQLRGGEQTLRAELGDGDYERYLAAEGRPTRVGVFNVLASSPAEQAGLRSGDEILSYGGKRVFDIRELNDLTVEGTPGQPVVLEVQRDTQTLQLVIPRGPIGIGGGPFIGGGQFGRRP